VQKAINGETSLILFSRRIQALMSHPANFIALFGCIQKL